MKKINFNSSLIFLVVTIITCFYSVPTSAQNMIWKPDSTSTFEVGTQVRSWTLLDEGVSTVLDNLQSMAGVNNIYFLAVNHSNHRPSGAKKFPHNPIRSDFEAEDSRLDFIPDLKRYGVIKPQRSEYEWLKKTDMLQMFIDSCRGRVLTVGAEVSHFPIPKKIIENNPQWQQRDINGKQPYRLDKIKACPNAPEVREYIVALFGDLAANYDLDYIQTCMLVYNDIEARYEKITGSPACFCNNCINVAQKIGFDLKAAIPVLKANQFAQPERDNWLALRRHSTTEIFRLISEEIARVKKNPNCHLRYNDTHPMRGMTTHRSEDYSVYIEDLKPYLGSIVNQDHQEQRGNKNETFERRKEWLKWNRDIIGTNMPLICGIAPRKKATPELVKEGIRVALTHSSKVNGLALKHYDGASFGLMRAFKQGMIDAGLKGMTPTMGKEIEEMKLDNFIPINDFVDDWGVQTNGKAKASYLFDYPSGKYNIRITYFDEKGGHSEVELFINNKKNVSFLMDDDSDCWRWRIFKNIKIKKGDKITLAGNADLKERVILDYIEFIPVK